MRSYLALLLIGLSCAMLAEVSRKATKETKSQRCDQGKALGDSEQDVADYRPIPGWAKLPPGFKFGMVSAVATDSKDRVYVFHRGKNPIVVFDPEGNHLRSWGDDTINTPDGPHGLRIDRDDNVWVTDTKHHQVLKFDVSGKLLLTLGQKGRPGVGRDQFDKPTDVAIAPTGEFYVSDGYGNNRIIKFAKDGNYLKEWGRKGRGRGEFELPHAVCLDAKGNVYVGDRRNNRIQVFDSEGNFKRLWTVTGAPYGMFLRGSKLFVADCDDHWVVVLDLEGRRLGRWGEKGKARGQFTDPHGICLDSQGAVYVAEIDGKRIQKFLPVALRKK